MGKKADIRQLEAVVKLYKMDDLARRAFGDYIEECKDHGERGSQSDGDFT